MKTPYLVLRVALSGDEMDVAETLAAVRAACETILLAHVAPQVEVEVVEHAKACDGSCGEHETAGKEE